MINQDNCLDNQRRIGITGGIASGKSTIAKYITKKKNIKLLEADKYTKILLTNNTKTYDQIIEHFGTKIIDKQSSQKKINKEILRKIIFNDKTQRKWIENLLHPIIKQKMIQDCQKYKNEKILLLEVPLLFQAKFTDLCTEIWLIKCKSQIQKTRLIQRDKITAFEAEKIIKLQPNFMNHEKHINTIINTEGGKNLWQNAINKLI